MTPDYIERSIGSPKEREQPFSRLYFIFIKNPHDDWEEAYQQMARFLITNTREASMDMVETFLKRVIDPPLFALLQSKTVIASKLPEARSPHRHVCRLAPNHSFTYREWEELIDDLDYSKCR